VRFTPATPTVVVQQLLDPRRIVRWVWLARAVVACGILVAAMFVWTRASPSDTLLATLAFAVAILSAAGSAAWVELWQRPVGARMLGAQCAVDLVLVTIIVHVTGGWSSQFAALYLLVIAVAALVLPIRGALLVAGGAAVLYAADALWLRAGTPHPGVLVQLAVFAVVAAGAGVIAARLRQAGVGRDALAAQLVQVQLEAADILRTIRSGIVTVDGAGRLLYANPAAADLLGLPLRSAVGRPVLPLIAQVSPDLARMLEQSARRGVRTTRAEGRIDRDGASVEIGVTTTVADDGQADADGADPRAEGVGVTATAIFQDISDSKRLQALHVRAQRLEAVAELSASLAHEIRNPLASIRSATEQLARRLPPDADEDQQVLHGLVVREADRLSRLLAEFLDFARTRVTRLAPVDIGAVVRTAAQLATAHPDRGAGVAITVDVAGALPLVAGDDDLLHRAVFNLVLNAVQAVAGHGTVHVAATLRAGSEGLPLPAAGDAPVVAVTVRDDGPGIAPALRARLFEPFVTGKPGGTGLGLPIVHRAVEAHRGVVLVDDLAPGTQFTILLPVGEAATAAVDRAGRDPEAVDGPDILGGVRIEPTAPSPLAGVA
jgi:two-component system sensor histidine kinase PilS (NtrC family)